MLERTCLGNGTLYAFGVKESFLWILTNVCQLSVNVRKYAVTVIDHHICRTKIMLSLTRRLYKKLINYSVVRPGTMLTATSQKKQCGRIAKNRLK